MFGNYIHGATNHLRVCRRLVKTNNTDGRFVLPSAQSDPIRVLLFHFSNCLFGYNVIGAVAINRLCKRLKLA